MEIWTDVMLTAVAVTLVAAVAAVVWAAVVAVRQRSGGVARRENGVPARRIAVFTLAGTVLLLMLTFAAGSSEPIEINGEPFADALSLRAADMFIGSSLVLLVVAAVAYVYAEIKGKIKGSPQAERRFAPSGKVERHD